MQVDSSLTVRIVRALCLDLGTPVAHELLKKVQSGDWKAAFAMKVSPSSYTDPVKFKLDNNVVELLRKIQLNVPGINRAKVAEDAFWASEAQCKQTNDRLHKFVFHGPFEPEDLRIIEFLDEARRFVRKVLGPLPRTLTPSFGPGATLEDRVPLTTVPDKITNRPTITREARDLLPFFWESAWGRCRVSDFSRISDPKTVIGNRFTTVPKTALKDRGICVEPSINVAFQLDVGRFLKKRLKLSGLDLKEGQAKHRVCAQWASVWGTVATIDLSNASDTLAKNLVKLLLPHEWYQLLESLRSPTTAIRGKIVRLEKFSSMGNGYTFELETLVFAAVAHASAVLDQSIVLRPGKDLHVYGDDIIVPTCVAKTLIAALTFFGFTTNKEKTFLEGPFRESCGGDYFRGMPVRAHYLESIPSTPAELITLCNGLRRAYGPLFERYGLKAWRIAYNAIPKELRLHGPSSLGDAVIHHPNWWANYREENGCGTCEGIVAVNTPEKWYHWKDNVQLASFLFGVHSSGPIAKSDDVVAYQRIRLPVLDRPTDYQTVFDRTPYMGEYDGLSDVVRRHLISHVQAALG